MINQHEEWLKLELLIDKPKEFVEAYILYLEKSRIYSPQREILYKALLKIKEKL